MVCIKLFPSNFSLCFPSTRIFVLITSPRKHLQFQLLLCTLNVSLSLSFSLFVGKLQESLLLSLCAHREILYNIQLKSFHRHALFILPESRKFRPGAEKQMAEKNSEIFIKCEKNNIKGESWRKTMKKRRALFYGWRRVSLLLGACAVLGLVAALIIPTSVKL